MNSRKQFSLQDKVKLIEACKTKSQSKVAQEFSVAKGTLNGFLKDKIKIMEQFEKSSPKSVHRKRQREGENPEEEEALYLCFNEKRLQGVMPSGGVIKEKAKQIAASKGKQLNASDGWLHNWKNRFNIKHKKSHGETQSADHPAAEKYLNETLPNIFKDYEPHNIFNGDEFGLYPRGLPDRGFVRENENPSGLKMAKDSILFS